MALVDYDSSDSAEDPVPPPAKRRKSSIDRPAPSSQANAALPSMPPLPSAFHDLYASTVRQSVVDDPSLHQGRRRQTPHVVGNWPTHLYVEWRPTPGQDSMLLQLLYATGKMLGDGLELHGFLRSDLGSPTPLHISLSRPLSLTTAQKDDFLEKITNAIRLSSISMLPVRPKDLRWYKSPDSDRTFLILQVSEGCDVRDDSKPMNSGLTSVLARCNAIAKSFNQPSLYTQFQNGPVGSWFHISIAWTFDSPDEEAITRTSDLLLQDEFKEILSWEIEVSDVKAKIGNVITNIPLSGVASTRFVSTGLGSIFE
ncbi:Fc.00g021590.m01.CDS01 [Cosmosporella sp. VM-42]